MGGCDGVIRLQRYLRAPIDAMRMAGELPEGAVVMIPADGRTLTSGEVADGWTEIGRARTRRMLAATSARLGYGGGFVRGPHSPSPLQSIIGGDATTGMARMGRSLIRRGVWGAVIGGGLLAVNALRSGEEGQPAGGPPVDGQSAGGQSTDRPIAQQPMRPTEWLDAATARRVRALAEELRNAGTAAIEAARRSRDTVTGAAATLAETYLSIHQQALEAERRRLARGREERGEVPQVEGETVDLPPAQARPARSRPTPGASGTVRSAEPSAASASPSASGTAPASETAGRAGASASPRGSRRPRARRPDALERYTPKFLADAAAELGSPNYVVVVARINGDRTLHPVVRCQVPSQEEITRGHLGYVELSKDPDGTWHATTDGIGGESGFILAQRIRGKGIHIPLVPNVHFVADLRKLGEAGLKGLADHLGTRRYQLWARVDGQRVVGFGCGRAIPATIRNQRDRYGWVNVRINRQGEVWVYPIDGSCARTLAEALARGEDVHTPPVPLRVGSRSDLRQVTAAVLDAHARHLRTDILDISARVDTQSERVKGFRIERHRRGALGDPHYARVTLHRDGAKWYLTTTRDIRGSGGDLLAEALQKEGVHIALVPTIHERAELGAMRSRLAEWADQLGADSYYLWARLDGKKAGGLGVGRELPQSPPLDPRHHSWVRVRRLPDGGLEIFPEGGKSPTILQESITR